MFRKLILVFSLVGSLSLLGCGVDFGVAAGGSPYYGSELNGEIIDTPCDEDGSCEYLYQDYTLYPDYPYFGGVWYPPIWWGNRGHWGGWRHYGGGYGHGGRGWGHGDGHDGNHNGHFSGHENGSHEGNHNGGGHFQGNSSGHFGGHSGGGNVGHSGGRHH
jgi:hypothetical protein